MRIFIPPLRIFMHRKQSKEGKNIVLSQIRYKSRKKNRKKCVPTSASQRRYKSRDEFCADVRQMFINCEVFNEDDSPVGKAGHGMRSFFEMRWTEITGAPPPHTQTHS
ncbi:hypothetical protein HZH66_003396 [Vespula vulgaris]|uniref:Bromo domain-containing protein n=1 Tax=Vespula vulgaris TaxID=7454 RepID=A0A834NIA3_VESVU|nr:hypothetical protein HZH66_003396 [Vespula vulgaris]